MAGLSVQEAGGWWWRSRKTLVALGLGQLVSLLVTATGFASSELSRRGINVPTSQSLLNYLLLAIVYGTILLRRRKPLQTKYRLRKYIGVAICAIGLVLVVFSDVHAGDRAGGRSPVKGDILVIAGATLYAISNATEEFLVKASDQIELMGMMGLFGALISVWARSMGGRCWHHDRSSNEGEFLAKVANQGKQGYVCVEDDDRGGPSGAYPRRRDTKEAWETLAKLFCKKNEARL
ncbi:hypothetical protein PR202_gb00794 [Eleusine coracana subsp. coracana]|uniref:Uncharacterized protein n=1 Tax=Eleusine coracana subsp. coracana TaxID=191504 RepID=A0AAV5DUY1_ELECO|nr:hypothetical protein PR202_gb00794 [Eleusine coracana subsp. coracana]